MYRIQLIIHYIMYINIGKFRKSVTVKKFEINYT